MDVNLAKIIRLREGSAYVPSDEGIKLISGFITGDYTCTHSFEELKFSGDHVLETAEVLRRYYSNIVSPGSDPSQELTSIVIELFKSEQPLKTVDLVRQRNGDFICDLLIRDHIMVPTLLHHAITDAWLSGAELERIFGKFVAYIVNSYCRLLDKHFRTWLDKKPLPQKLSLLRPDTQSLHKCYAQLIDLWELIEETGIYDLTFLLFADFLSIAHRSGPISKDLNAPLGQYGLWILAPLARMLGASQIEQDIQDHSFAILNPEKYLSVREGFDALKQERKKPLEDLISDLRSQLGENGVQARIYYREKGIYKAYQKKEDHKIALDEVWDLYAVRVVTETEEECYKVLEVLSGPAWRRWQDHRGFHDYIKSPRIYPSGEEDPYRSIHVVLHDRNDHLVEVQIRTKDMHWAAEKGPASQIHYNLFKTTGLGPRPRGDDFASYLQSLGEMIGFAKSHQVRTFAETTPDQKKADNGFEKVHLPSALRSGEVLLQDLNSRICSYLPSSRLSLVRQAYEFAALAHSGQERASGDPYLVHPIEVAKILADFRMDAYTIAAGLLHDSVEDARVSLDQIKEGFGDEVASLVDGVTKLEKPLTATDVMKTAENLRKIISAMSRDIRVIIIKLADRLHNMRTLDPLPEDKRISISRETSEIYIPLAHRLGIHWMKAELEDLVLRYQHPETYRDLVSRVGVKRQEVQKNFDEIINVLNKRLRETGIEAEIVQQPKHVFSIYKEIHEQGRDLDEIHDLSTIRVLTNDVRDCYATLGVIHSLWKPVPGRFKDYIALPKVNGYQSLHTTVIGPYGRRVAVQIRTHEMNRISEDGITAHWRYGKGLDTKSSEVQHAPWLKQLLEWHNDLKDPLEFLFGIKEDLFVDEVYVFTPKGDLFSFPKGATIIDFAYRIHSEIGHRCSGARVNGRQVDFTYVLQAGDTVEVVTANHQTPSRDWLKLVRTPRAKSRIRNWIKSQQRERSVHLGRQILEGDLSHYKFDYAALKRAGRIESIAKELGMKDEETLLASIGYGKLTPRQILAKLVPPEKLEPGREQPQGTLERLFRLVSGQKRDLGVKVKGVEDVVVRFARCCDPLPGEDIVGFITRGRGVTVHASSCPTVLESDPHRKIEVSWQDNGRTPRPIKIEVSCVDRPGLLAAISAAITSADVNITRAQVRTFPDQKALNTFEVMLTNSDQLKHVLSNISKVKGVYNAARVKG